jgi:serine/threonine protein kinase
VGFGLPCLRNYIVNLSAFEGPLIIGESDEVRNHVYHRVDDAFLVFVKSIPLSECVNKSQMEDEIENLMNLRHPCIAAPIGYVLPIDSGSSEELKIVRLYLEGCSLSEVLSVNPVWWTSTVKAKVVAGIVLGFRFAHSLGLFHGHLTANNIFFDSDHFIQIVDFQPILFEVEKNESEGETQLGGFSKEKWIPERDIRAFAAILFEIVVGRPATDEASVPTNIPAFVSQIIESELHPTSGTRYPFDALFVTLKQNDFRIEDGVDSEEVSAFVRWVESADHPDQ